jgi:ATP-dependent RNA helicase DeaD
MQSPTTLPTTFSELGLDARLVRETEALGYTTPTPIQVAAIPLVLRGSDLLGQAATGTGKTAAFSLPMLQNLAQTPASDARPRALVLVPTRELAVQVHKTMQAYAHALSLRLVEIYGGSSFTRQIRALERGVDVVVATPGRAIDLEDQGYLKLDNVSIVVLDEADEMLNMGFADDIETLLGKCATPRQTLLFSATFPPRLKHIANRHLNQPERVDVTKGSAATPTAATVEHVAYVVPRGQKIVALGRILEATQARAALVFCRSREDVDNLCEKLASKGVRAEMLHGGLSQDQRDRVMTRFRRGTCEVLIATDVAARGLDVDHLTHVINFDLPTNAESYVHRSGRTGRAGREGFALTLLDPSQQRMIRSIERVVAKSVRIAKVPSAQEVRAQRLQATAKEIADLDLELTQDAIDSDTQKAIDGLLRDQDPARLFAAAFVLAHRASGRENDRFAEPGVATAALRPPASAAQKNVAEAAPRPAPLPSEPAPSVRTAEIATTVPTAAATELQDRAPKPTRAAAATLSNEAVSTEEISEEKIVHAPFEQEARSPALAATPSASGKETRSEIVVARKRSAIRQPILVEAPTKAAPAREARKGDRVAARPDDVSPARIGFDSAPPSSGALRRERKIPDRVRAHACPENFAAAIKPRKSAEAEVGGGFVPRRKPGLRETTQLHFDVGAGAGIRPADLVGAIANETGLDSRDIGSIRIDESSSWVEIPAVVADTLVQALRSTSIRGNRARVRRV